jgi:hypothetical protein
MSQHTMPEVWWDDLSPRLAWTDAHTWEITDPAEVLALEAAATEAMFDAADGPGPAAADRAEFDAWLRQYDAEHPIPDPLPETYHTIEEWDRIDRGGPMTDRDVQAAGLAVG